MKSEKGFSLVEVIVALGLMAILAVGLLSGLATTFRAGGISQERVIAESLAKSQWEYIKAQDYILTADYDDADPEKCYQLIDIPDELAVKNYTINIDPPQAVTSPGGDSDFELQSITVVIHRGDKPLLMMSDYKVGKLS
jgi:prepilin-type N-terminal cleavage/methylation domain-containing protein